MYLILTPFLTVIHSPPRCQLYPFLHAYLLLPIRTLPMVNTPHTLGISSLYHPTTSRHTLFYLNSPLTTLTHSYCPTNRKQQQQQQQQQKNNNNNKTKQKTTKNKQTKKQQQKNKKKTNAITVQIRPNDPRSQ